MTKELKKPYKITRCPVCDKPILQTWKPKAGETGFCAHPDYDTIQPCEVLEDNVDMVMVHSRGKRFNVPKENGIVCCHSIGFILESMVDACRCNSNKQ